MGYVNGLRDNGHEIKDRAFLLIGLGGAGSAIAFALAENRVSRLHVQELDPQKLSKTVSDIQKYFSEISVTTGGTDVADFDVIANATPLGMSPTDPLPINLDGVREGQLVTDMIMSPDVTPLLNDARARGRIIHKGYEALLGQAKANMEFFGYG